MKAEQIRGLYSQSITGVLANIVSGSLLAYILWPGVDHTRIALWMGGVVAVQIARAAALLAFRRKVRKDDDLGRWGTLFTGIVVVSGLIWGSVGVFMLPEGPLMYHAVIALWMVGVSAGGIVAYAGYAPSALGCILPITLPVTVRFLVTGDFFHRAVAISILAYLVFILAAWRGVNSLLVRAIELNFIKEREIGERKRAEATLVLMNQKLEAAASEINTLRGILPICAHCKNIRDDQGYWNKIETYIRTHSEAEFTHGICPDCVNSLYPNLPIVEKKT